MALNYGPNIVKNGLVLSLDVADLNSYPGSGDYWYDTSGNGSVVTKSTASLTTSIMSGALAFNLDATGKHFSGIINGTMPATNSTIEAWIYPALSEVQADDRGCIVLLYGNSGMYMSWNKSNQKMSNYWYNHPSEGYHENGPAAVRGTWNHWAAVWDYSSGTLRQYANGVKASTDAATQGNSSTGTTLYIGQESTYRQFAGGIAVIRIYNTALSTEQVQQNYNSTKSRFSL